MRTLVLLLLLTLAAQADDMYIVPGQRVGPITSSTTWPDLVHLYGSHAKQRNVLLPDGQSRPGAMVNFQLDTERLDLVFRKDGTVMLVVINGPTSQWETLDAISVGSTLGDLERANHGPFELYGFGWANGGVVTSWKDGKLSQQHDLNIIFTDGSGNGLNRAELDAVRGERRLSSDDPILRMLNPKVVEMIINLGPPE